MYVSIYKQYVRMHLLNFFSQLYVVWLMKQQERLSCVSWPQKIFKLTKTYQSTYMNWKNSYID